MQEQPMRYYRAEIKLSGPGLTPAQATQLAFALAEMAEAIGASVGGGFVETDRDGADLPPAEKGASDEQGQA